MGRSSQFHRYNSMWTRDVQDVIFAVLLCGWLGGMPMNGKPAAERKLLTIEEVGEILNGKQTINQGSKKMVGTFRATARSIRKDTRCISNC
jgi:hypothetical protein